MDKKLHRAVLLLAVCVMNFPVAASELVPFHAVIQTVPAPAGECDVSSPGCFKLEIGGAGQASQMGRIEISGPSEVDLSFEQQTGISTLTAANGDTITISFSGTVHQEPSGAFTFEGKWEVIEGTGRFTDATGSGGYSGAAAGPAGTLVLVGGVSHPSGEFARTGGISR